MTHLFTKTAISIVTIIGLVLAIAITPNDVVHATEFKFNWKGDAGYLAQGSFNRRSPSGKSLRSPFFNPYFPTSLV